MPHSNLVVNNVKIKKALFDSKSFLAYWTDNWDSSESEWWWICCDDKQYDIDNIKSSRARRGIRKGLDNCEVKKINSQIFPDLAYDIYFNSMRSYGIGELKILSRENYGKYIDRLSKYQGYELWGAFVEDNLAAFAACVVLGDAVAFGSTKSNPEMHRYNPNNALFYEMTRYYLSCKNISYVTNGHRTLLHDTSIDEFLIRLGFRKIFCRLNLQLSKPAKLVNSGLPRFLLKNIKASRVLFPRIYSKVEGFFKLTEIGETF